MTALWHGGVHSESANRRNHLVLNAHLWQAADHYGLQKLSKRQIFEVVMNIFFRHPTRELSDPVNEALGSMWGLKIGVHIRLGGPKHSDAARYAGAVPSVVECFVAETLATCGSACSVFLTSDSEEAQHTFLLAMAASNVTVAVIHGDTIHLENARKTGITYAQHQHFKTYADWYALTKMHRMVASRSGFSETAGWFNNIPSRQLLAADACFFTDSVELPVGADGQQP